MITIFGIQFEYWELLLLAFAIGGVILAYRQIDHPYDGKPRRSKL